ncbi:SDR family oxidoreductase [Amycolatopsis alkalitolerans]|uniref:dTDP-4-dehydrorhamnose reductase n=1 Tax=Amycolatopsis alkalitolerans TaxID=2547244 RepID=A0A5C4LUY7_9PSEU|nr:sugar nucleotide-binding protein [Amycolatopsis alkalitolerans]TNC22256.1 sugar nucleotide-binding protein [Amycolatopsis alkalitolerans]
MRVYITGATGFVGSNVAKLYAEYHKLDVVLAGRRPPEQPLPGSFSEVDLLDPASVRGSILTAQPDVIVHAAILNDFPLIYANRRLGWDSYVTATRSVADAANEVGAVLVYVSTDWVFDGTHPNSTEDTPPNPINYYGFLKAAGELVTLERAHDPIVARIAGVNGVHWAKPNSPRSQDAGFGYFVSSLVDALSKGEPFTVWDSDTINTRATPSLATESANMMLRLVQVGARGTFHCCGGESTSRIELAYAAAEVFDLDATLIHTGPPDPTAIPQEPVPQDTSLTAIITATKVDYKLPAVRALLAEFRSQRETGEVQSLAAF